MTISVGTLRVWCFGFDDAPYYLRSAGELSYLKSRIDFSLQEKFIFTYLNGLWVKYIYHKIIQQFTLPPRWHSLRAAMKIDVVSPVQGIHFSFSSWNWLYYSDSDFQKMDGYWDEITYEEWFGLFRWKAFLSFFLGLIYYI